MPSKIHFEINGNPACGRGTRTHASVTQVTCGLCAQKDAYIEAMAKAQADKMERFLAQEPRAMIEPWHEGRVTMSCGECGHMKFREADRTCYGHYANYVCANCGHTESRLTETGMSF